MLFIEFTFIVLKFDKFKIFKEVHCSNIELIFSTLEVSKFNKLIDCKELHPLNILAILITFEVIKYSKAMNCNNFGRNMCLEDLFANEATSPIWCQPMHKQQISDNQFRTIS